MAKYLFFFLNLIIFISHYAYAKNNSNEINLKSNQEKYLLLQSDTIQTVPSSSLLKPINNKIIHVIANVKNDTSISTSIATEIIKSSHFTDTADYLKNIPGFSMKRNGGANNDLTFRGMSGSKMRILIDNTEIVGACCSHMDPASSYINLETFDILNIIKGPQTVLYGSTVSGGILQCQRYRPYCYISKIQLDGDITYGSNQSVSKNIDSILGNKYRYIRLIGNLAYSDDYYDGNNCRVHSAWYKWNADSILSFTLKELDTYIEINLGQGNGRANYANKTVDGLCFARESYGLKIEKIDINTLLSKIEFQTWQHHIHHIMANNKLAISLTQKKGLFFDNKPHCCSNINRTINALDRCLWGIRSIATFEFENMLCHSGIDMHLNHHQKNTQHDNNYSTDILIKDIGIFNESVYDLLSNRKLIGGIRIEYISTNIYGYHNTFNKYQIIYPTGFIRYENNSYPEFSYYVGIGTSQNFPDYWTLISSKYSEDIKKMEQIIQLKPEKTIQIDTGIHFKKSKIDGWISSYAGYIKDYIYYNTHENYGENPITDYINNMHAKICGTEIGLSYKFNDYWYGKSNISWSWGINADNQYTLLDTSPLEGTLVCQFQQKNFYLEALWRLVAPEKYIQRIILIPNKNTNFFNAHTNIPGFGVFSIYLTYKKIFKYITYSIGVNNLFNQNYMEHNTNKFNYHEYKKLEKIPIYEPGRTWWIKAKIKL